MLKEEDHEFGFRNTEFAMPIRYPSEGFEQSVGYMSLEFSLGWKYKFGTRQHNDGIQRRKTGWESKEVSIDREETKG